MMPDSNNSEHVDRVDKMIAEYLRRSDQGEAVDQAQFLAEHADVADRLQSFLDHCNAPENTRGSVCEALPVEGESTPDPSRNPQSDTGGQAAVADARDDQAMPARIGRYEVRQKLGGGGFGVVYLAHDPHLDRLVALKVPRRRHFSSESDADQFMAEARTAAQLHHPGLVPVHDVSQDADTIFIVQHYVGPRNLDTYLKSSSISPGQCAALLADVAEALAFAHQKGFVHRDLKPGNILLDDHDRPLVADFGLTLHESVQRRRRGERSGTPHYMSPEQARGESHRLDGRSDIWSLGVIMYQMLTGRRPFAGDSLSELYDEIKYRDPVPPRQIKPDLSPELERICLKCLSKRATDRYSSASDLAGELRMCVAAETTSDERDTKGGQRQPRILPKGLRSFGPEDAGFFLELLPGPRDRDGLPESIRFWKTRIEARDAHETFAVGVMYGPSGCGKSSLVKAGLLPRLAGHVVPICLEATPGDMESRLIKILKKRLPATAQEPSLSGMLEVVRETGLSDNRKLLVVLDQFEQWLHAHGDDPSSQLLDALRQCDGANVQCLVMVREEYAMPCLRFLDQLDTEMREGENFGVVDLFDQRHAEKVLRLFGQAFGALPEKDSELSPAQQDFLTQAIRELSDKKDRVICVRLALFAEMIKSKPWVASSLTELGGAHGVGVAFLEESLSADSAKPTHRVHQEAARAVLKRLLPESETEGIKGGMRSYQDLLEASGYAKRPDDFDAVIRMLDSELRLITPVASEKGEGGSEKGEGGSEKEGEFSSSAFTLHTSYFQLTHDYLVPSLRDWLTRKQRETREGRAELKLEERTATWSALRENKQLPTLREWLGIRALTAPKKWTPPQRVMMRRADTFHLSRLITAIVLVALITAAGLWTWNRVERSRRDLLAQKAKEQEVTRIQGLVGRLVSAEPNQLPDIVRELDANPEVAATFLSPLVSASATTVDEKRTQLHARLARVSRDASLVEPLVEELLTGKVTYVIPIRQLLRPSAAQLTEKLRGVLRDERADAQWRFRAALALADYVPPSEAASWTEQDLKFVAEQLVSSNAEFQPLLREAMRPMRARLLGDLERFFTDATATDAQRLSAANAFADYAGDDVGGLSRLLAVATPGQFAVLYPLVAASPTPSTVENFAKIAATLPAEDLGSVERVPFGQRRANAAVTLLRLGEREKMLPVFEWTDDPEALTQFIFRCRPRGVGAEALLDCLQLVSDAANDRYPRHTHYALLLALGEYSLEQVPASRRDALLKQLADWYRNDPSSGVHGATGWLLRQWGQADVVRDVDQTPVPYAPDREWFTLAITVTPTPLPRPKEKPAAENGGAESEPPEYAEPTESRADDTSKPDASSKPAAPAEKTEPEPPAEPLPPMTFCYTFVVFPAGEYTIGSVEDELDRVRLTREQRHAVILTRPFALLDREITWKELIAFRPYYAGFMQEADAKPGDAGAGPDWYDSVGFCRWLGEQMGMSESDQAYPAPESLDKEKYPREPDPTANWAPRNWPMELGGRGFRLPTESEWEVANRAGARTAYGYGSEVSLLGRFGWFMENSGKRGRPPKELRPSVHGLFDLHGNMYEWTHDWYDDFDAALVTDPLGAEGGSERVLRGGGGQNDAALCRSAHRFAHGPTYRTINRSFRLALTPVR